MMKVLLDGGADATLALTNRTTTAMLASGGNAPEPKVLEAVTLLVEHGVDVNAFNANGQTMLHNAAQRGPQLGRRVRGAERRQARSARQTGPHGARHRARRGQRRTARAAAGDGRSA